jgi:hypothetical protein
MVAYIALTIDVVAESTLRESFKLLEKPGYSHEGRLVSCGSLRVPFRGGILRGLRRS